MSSDDTAPPDGDGRTVASRISEAEAGARLDIWLAGRFTYHSRSAWQRLVEDGSIRLNGRGVRPSRILRPGDEVVFEVGEFAEPAVNLSFSVVAEDEFFVAVNKPAPLPCHPAGPFFRHTLWYLLRGEYGDIHLLSRLDRETSGLILVAKSPTAAAALGAADIRKTYLTLVEGDFPERMEARGFLGDDPESEIRKKRRFTLAADGEVPPGAEFAATTFRLLERRDDLSLLAAELLTGRTHQIRATLCSLGYPMVGDKLYGVDPSIFLRFIHDQMTDVDWERLRLPRQALHSWKVSFRHPATGHPMELTAPCPGEWGEGGLSRQAKRPNF